MLPNTIKFLFEAGHIAVSADNSQPWKFKWNDNKIIISYDIVRVPYMFFAFDHPACLLSFGSVIENMDQAAKSIGIQIEWTLHPTHTNNYTYAEGKILNNVDLTKVNYDHELFTRHTNRFPFKKKPLPTSVLTALENEEEGSTRIIAINEKTTIKKVAKLVKDSSKIRFQTEEVHDWLMTHMHFDPFNVDKGSGLDIKTVNLPPGGSLFMKFIKPWKNMKFLNKLGAYNLMAQQEQVPVASAPALIAIVGGEGFENGLQAGALMERLWIKLNTLGVAVQPYFVITDQLERSKAGKIPPHLTGLANSISKESKNVFDLNHGEKLLMLLRVGYPKNNPVRSKRIPLNVVYRDGSTKK